MGQTAPHSADNAYEGQARQYPTKANKQRGCGSFFDDGDEDMDHRVPQVNRPRDYSSRGDGGSRFRDATPPPYRDHGVWEEAEAEGTEIKAQELCRLLRSLEDQMASVKDFKRLGQTYRDLSDWTLHHSEDEDLPQVLQKLTPAHMYPAWRRQALEEAYMLLYEDMAQQGNKDAIENLPEPPTSAEIGFRKLPEGLLNSRDRSHRHFSNAYEAGHPCCYRRRWDYDIRRTSKPVGDLNGDKSKSKRVPAGREIVAKEFSSRACPCAADPLGRFMQTLSLKDGCCGRERKGSDIQALTRGQNIPKPHQAPAFPTPPGQLS